MAYATQADVIDKVGAKVLAAIADDDDNGTADPLVVGLALDAATSIADSYIGAYLPLPSVTDALRNAVIVIAVENMRRDRGQSTKDSTAAYDAAMKWLADVAAGRALLFPPTVGVVDPGELEVSSGARVWTREIGRRVF